MRKLTLVGIAVLFFLSLSFVSADAAEKMAYVDLSKVFDEYAKTKDYEKVLDKKQKDYESERENRLNEIKKYEDKLKLLSDKEREAKKDEYESKIKDFQDFVRKEETALRQEGFEKEKELLKDIEDAVRQYSEKEGYTMVFNDRVLIYQSQNLDITDKITDILKQTYKK